MGLVDKTIRIKERQGVVDFAAEGKDFLVVDKLNTTHHNNAGDDVYLCTSVKTGRMIIFLPVDLIGGVILPTGDQG